MPIEQQSGSVEPETQVFAKITTKEAEAATIPATTPVNAPPTLPQTPQQTSARRSKSLTRRIARRILGPNLMTKK